MPNYTTLDQLNDTGIQAIMNYPSSGDPFFWGKIMFGIFAILTLVTFFEERRRLGRGNLLSSLAIASVSTMVITWAGTIGNFIGNQISVMVTVIGFIFIALWFLISE